MQSDLHLKIPVPPASEIVDADCMRLTIDTHVPNGVGVSCAISELKIDMPFSEPFFTSMFSHYICAFMRSHSLPPANLGAAISFGV